MRVQIRRVAAAAVLVGLSTGAAARQEAAEPDLGFARVRAELGFNTEFDGGAPGDVTTIRLSGGAGIELPAGDRGRLNMGVDYERSDYDFSGATAFIPGSSDPWGTVHRERLSAVYSRQATERLSWLVGGDIGLSGEEGADLGKSVVGGGFGAVRWAASDSLTIGIGASARSRIEDSVLFLPVFMLDWQIAEEWRLTNDGKPGLLLTYSATDDWTFGAFAFYEFRDFRLDDGGPLPGGAAQETRVPVGLSATYAPSKRFSIGAEAGAAFGQNYEVLNAAGVQISDIDADPSPFLALTAVLRF